jgi:hypothetical protein
MHELWQLLDGGFRSAIVDDPGEFAIADRI